VEEAYKLNEVLHLAEEANVKCGTGLGGIAKEIVRASRKRKEPMKGIGEVWPKQLIPVANKPISQYVLGDLIGAGITDVAIVTGNVYPDKVKEYFGDGAKFGAEISYVHQGEPANQGVLPMQ